MDLQTHDARLLSRATAIVVARAAVVLRSRKTRWAPHHAMPHASCYVFKNTRVTRRLLQEVIRLSTIRAPHRHTTSTRTCNHLVAVAHAVVRPEDDVNLRPRAVSSHAEFRSEPIDPYATRDRSIPPPVGSYAES